MFICLNITPTEKKNETKRSYQNRKRPIMFCIKTFISQDE